MNTRFFPISLGVVFLLCASAAEAANLTITSPSSAVTVAAGDDYFTDVVDSPADGTQRRMIGWEQGFDGPSVGVSGGIWQGTNAITGGYIFPIFPSLKGTLMAEPLPGDRSLTPYGINHRVDTSKYTYLSYHLNHTARSTFAIYWESNDAKSQYWPDPSSPRRASFDGAYHDAGIPNSGWHLYNFDLVSGVFDQTQGSWAGNVFALRLDPSVAGPAGAVTQLDWVRLVDPNSAPDITINWNSSGITGSHVITVYIDDNNVGFDGSPIAKYTFGNDPGTITFPSAMLPPGDHYFYIEAQTAAGGSYTGSPDRSGYTPRIRVLDKPRIYITAPSPASGDSYAAVERGNEWDMDAGGTDVANLAPAWSQVWRQFITPSFAASGDAEEAGTVFQAQAEPPYFHIGNSESDVQVHMDVPPADTIDPSHYRYVVYRMAIGEAGYPTIHDKVLKGWVSRIVAWNNDVLVDVNRTKAHIVYEGWHTYWFDMADGDSIEVGQPWESFFRLRNFRLDPGEFTIAGFYTWFLLDYLHLVGENRTPGDTYDIKYHISDTDSSNFTVQIFYDTDRSGFDGTLITTLNGQSAGDHTYTWDTSALPDDTDYYIYITVNDGTNTARRYSRVHLKTGAYSASNPNPQSPLAEFDFDGDGSDDHVVFRPWNGVWYFNQSTAGISTIQWGNSIYRPIYGDFDGDGITDRGLVVRSGIYYLYYIIYSQSGATYSRIWGLQGDQLAIGDYNGNGRDELAVWRPSNGCWYVLDESDGVTTQCWGLPGDYAMPRDYDGDGNTDFAIWRPSTGTWWILNSSNSPAFSAYQWGLPGDIPIPGAYGSDTKSDVAVFRPGNGTWYVFDPDTSGVTIQQWGLPGDIPRTGDFNGDGVLDFTVYRNGIWYHNYRNGGTAAVGWGLPGDWLPSKYGVAPF